MPSNTLIPIDKTWRWRLGHAVEHLGFWLVRRGARIVRATCQCSTCQGDMESFFNEAEDRSMQLCYAEEQLRENLLICEVRDAE
jgi:hypothetical protein